MSKECREVPQNNFIIAIISKIFVTYSEKDKTLKELLEGLNLK